MERDQLKAWLEEGLSLPQIGKLTGRDPSTVGYWVQKYGLVANARDRYAPRGGLTREQLEPLVEGGATLQEMATELGRSISTIRYWLAHHGLKTANRRGRRPRVPREQIEASIRAGVRTVTADCHVHGCTTFVIESCGKLRCRACRMARVTEWRRRTKRRLVEEAGGKCHVCGYSHCMAALEFHHLDPSTKKFALSRRGVTRSYAEALAEAEKCVLLCANCHAEVEAGYSTLQASESETPPGGLEPPSLD